MCGLQEQLRLFAKREKPPAKARKAGVPKQDAVPDFLNGRQLRDYQARSGLLFPYHANCKGSKLAHHSRHNSKID